MPKGEIQRLLYWTWRLQVQNHHLNHHPHDHHHNHHNHTITTITILTTITIIVMIITMMIGRSVKPYKMSNCVGGGRNADSCTAIKTKPRLPKQLILIISIHFYHFSVTELCASFAVTVGSSRRTWWQSASAAGRKRSGVSKPPTWELPFSHE